jgi:hypothetical protein
VVPVLMRVLVADHIPHSRAGERDHREGRHDCSRGQDPSDPCAAEPARFQGQHDGARDQPDVQELAGAVGEADRHGRTSMRPDRDAAGTRSAPGAV